MARTLDSEALVDLADALADGQWHSGEVLADRFGITRAGLAKRLGHLKEWGLQVETRSGQGYRLMQALERLDSAQLQAQVPAGLRVTVVPSVDSTNRVLAESMIDQDPQALLAEHQSAGRGRRGRVWQSPFAANLYLSLAWNWSLWPPQLSALSLVVGVICARTLKAQGLEPVQLKWPNDLWVDRKKLGGILIEQTGEFGGSCRVIIGIGLNISMLAGQAEAVDQPWTSLDQELARLGKPRASRNVIARELLTGLHQGLIEFESTGLESCRDTWQSLDALRDKPITTLDSPQRRGIGRGIDRDGAYQIETAHCIESVHAGDVSLRTI